MKIDASDKEVQDIFSLGYFRIPRFQRPYSWGDEEVGNFWSDVIVENNDNYFIGSMVVYQERKPYFGIVDGQQRLTTITLILAAVRNALILLDEEDLARGIHYYIERPNIDNVNEFILNSETSFPYLQNHIQTFNGLKISCDAGAEELNLESAFKFISNSLKEYIQEYVPSLDFEGLEPTVQLSLFESRETKRLQAINLLKDVRDKVLSLKLVFIQLDNEEDAYLIFETLNARGRDLTTSDLAKNLLLKRIKPVNLSLDTAKETWNRMISRFDDAGIQNGMDPFLYHYWLSRHEYTTDKTLFSKLKEYSETSEAASQLLSDLQENSDYYLRIIDPENRKWSRQEQAISDSLRALASFNVKQQIPMVLALLRAYQKGDITLRMLRQTLEKIEAFHYAFNAVTSQRSSGSISTHYSKHAIVLSKASDHAQRQAALHSLLSGLRERLPSLAEFSASFMDLAYASRKTRSKKTIQYTLQKVMNNLSTGVPIDYNLTTIEHLLPESKASREDELIGNIGNLILVDAQTNSSELRDLSFLEKKKILIDKGYRLEDFILEADEWGEQQIRARAKYLAERVYFDYVQF